MPQVEQAPSLRDTIAAQFALAEANEPGANPDLSSSQSAPVEDADQGTGQNTEAQSKDGGASATPQAGKKPEEGEAPKAEPARAAGDEEPGDLDAPARWTKEEKEEFYALPKKAQEILLKRNRSAEAEITKKFQAVAERGKQFDAIEEVLKPHQARFALNGHNAATYLQNVLTVGTYAEDDPVGFIKFFAQQKGINLAALAGNVRQPPQMQGNQPLRVDPATGQIIQHVGALQKQLEQVTGLVQRQYEERKARTDAEIVREIETFETATDEHGNLKHPFLDDVEQDMVLLIQNGETDLEKAYDRAVWSNPATRGKLLEQQQIRTSQRFTTEAQKKAKEAQKSSASLRSTGGPAAVQETRSGNLRDTIARALDATQRQDAV